jgi:hypothetical protein
VLFRTAALRDRNDVVKFDFGVFKLLLAVLAPIIVSSNNAHHGREGKVAASYSAFFLGFGHGFGSKEHRTYVAKDRADGFLENLRDMVWILLRSEVTHASFKP